MGGTKDNWRNTSSWLTCSKAKLQMINLTLSHTFGQSHDPVSSIFRQEKRTRLSVRIQKQSTLTRTKPFPKIARFASFPWKLETINFTKCHTQHVLQISEIDTLLSMVTSGVDRYRPILILSSDANVLILSLQLVNPWGLTQFFAVEILHEDFNSQLLQLGSRCSLFSSHHAQETVNWAVDSSSV